MSDRNRGDGFSAGAPGVAHGLHPLGESSVEGHDESGVTLVELLVAIVIMGVLFAGVAGALINFSKAAVNNERRVQSSGFLNSSQEQLQTIDWDLAVLYEDEVYDPDTLARLNDPDLQGSESGFDAVNRQFDGEDLVLVDGPEEDGRESLIPEPWVPDGDYEIFTFVTWADDIGDGTKAKRFTTIVRWTVFNQTLQQRFQSFRAPTSEDIEASAPLEVTQFNLAPSQIVIELDEEDGVELTTGTTVNDASVSVSFNRPVEEAKIGYFPDGEGPTDPDAEVTPTTDGIDTFDLAQDPTTFTDPGGWTRFTGSLPAGSGPFEDDSEASVTLYVWGTSTLLEVATRQLAMRFSSDAEIFQPTVLSATRFPDEITVKRVGGQDQLCGDVVLNATVDGLDPDGYVLATYDGEAGSTGVGLSPPPSGVSGSNDVFSRTFAKGSKSRWDPGTGNNATTTVNFDVKAVNPGNHESNLYTDTPALTVRRVTGSAPC